MINRAQVGEATYRLGALASAGTLLGIFLSGPVAVALVNVIHPQPPWQGAAAFAKSYHAAQLLPYGGGIVLVAALVVLLASVHAAASDEHRVLTSAALVFTAIFAAFIFFNYVVQTTYLPVLAHDYDESNAGMIAALSMTNPKSLAWGVEMWGWGFLGVATWLAAPVFCGSRLERAAALAFTANGPVSIFGALWTVAQPGWVLTSAGLVAFALWNLLLAVMAVLGFIVFRRRLRTQSSLPGADAVHGSPLAASPRLDEAGSG